MTNAEYTDDPTIPDAANLWRRIPPFHCIWDANVGRVRPSSAAFDDDPDGSPMSVVLAEESSDPQSVLAGHEGFALASFKAGLARECRLGIARDPLPEQPAHALVLGRKTKSVMRRLAKGSSWVIAPPISS